jgi:hypothetical protein
VTGLYRITQRDNPSNRTVEELDGLSVADGRWVLLREGATTRSDLATSDYTVELESHGGTWQLVDPEVPLPR